MRIWSIQGLQGHIVLNENGFMTGFVTIKQRVLRGRLHKVPDVQRLIIRHKLQWMAKIFGSHNDEMVQEFCASYVANIRGSFDRLDEAPKKDPLTKMLVRGQQIVKGNYLDFKEKFTQNL